MNDLVLSARPMVRSMEEPFAITSMEVIARMPGNVSYQQATAKLATLQAMEGNDLNPVCHTRLLSHGGRAERIIVLVHGLTNCPAQFAQFAPRLFEQGYDVLIPRMPRHGLADPLTNALSLLSWRDLVAFGDQTVDIASGLGREVTYLGLSAGGIVAADVAQRRSEVQRAVVIAPFLGILPNLAVINTPANALVAWLLQTIPNINTQYRFPFKGAPGHSYLGYSSRALGEVLRLGARVMRQASVQRAAASKILLVTNADDHAINNKLAYGLAQRWQDHGTATQTYTFARDLHLFHDLMDPDQRLQHVDTVYPILLDLLA